MHSLIKQAAIAIITIALSVLLFTALSNILQASTSQVTASLNLQVWQNINATTPLTMINWGNMIPSQPKTETAYLTTNAPCVNLTVTTSDWNPPELMDYAAFNYTAPARLYPGMINPVVFQLTIFSVVPRNITVFSFNIHLEGGG